VPTSNTRRVLVKKRTISCGGKREGRKGGSREAPGFEGRSCHEKKNARTATRNRPDGVPKGRTNGTEVSGQRRKKKNCDSPPLNRGPSPETTAHTIIKAGTLASNPGNAQANAGSQSPEQTRRKTIKLRGKDGRGPEQTDFKPLDRRYRVPRGCLDRPRPHTNASSGNQKGGGAANWDTWCQVQGSLRRESLYKKKKP